MSGVCYSTSGMQTAASYRIPFGLFYIVPVLVFCLIWFIPEVSSHFPEWPV